MINSFLALCVTISLLTIWAIILWHVVSWIGASANAVLAVRALLVAVVLMLSLADINAWLIGTPPRSLSMDRVPNIMVPERR